MFNKSIVCFIINISLLHVLTTLEAIVRYVHFKGYVTKRFEHVGGLLYIKIFLNVCMYCRFHYSIESP
jgi:hypothetical protein